MDRGPFNSGGGGVSVQPGKLEVVEEELTFLCRGFLLEEVGHSTEGGTWVDGPWAIILEIHGRLLASVSHWW